MKKLIIALALATAACATPALADVGISIRIGEPGFYGELDIGRDEHPRIINARPVLVVHRYRNLAPVYLRVPPGHQRNWSRYCDQYNACARPVYFVRDDWYRNEYAPRYRKAHGYDRDDRHDDRHDHDDHHDDHHDHDDHDGHHGDRH